MASVSKISAITDGGTLTPVRKRRTRPSHSPIKSIPETPLMKHSKSMILRGSKGLSPVKNYHLPTSALEFQEFSFLGADGTIDTSHVTSEQHEALRWYLKEHYGATELFFCQPLLVIGCPDNPPPENERPFTVAGLVAIWRRADDMKLVPIVGASGRGEEINLGSEIAEQLVMDPKPSQQVIIYLAKKVFADCTAIALLWQTLVIELPSMTNIEFVRRLRELPSRIKGSGLILRYHNGTLPGAEMASRAIMPAPQNAKGIRDTTDYVAKDGMFYPGSMIGSIDRSGKLYTMATAGILVQRGHEQRLTGAYHLWEKHDAQYSGLLGQTTNEAQRIFSVKQGNDPGAIVGFVRNRVGNTDIALLQLYEGVKFENKFMESTHKPRRLAKGNEQRPGDMYVFDGFSTGWQKLMGFGARYSIGRSRTEPSKTVFIELEQGVYMTNEPVMEQQPIIREGICGSALLKTMDTRRPMDDADTVMKRGEIAGMMRLVDIRNPDTASLCTYLCYAETFDPLISAGWQVAEVPDTETDLQLAAVEDKLAKFQLSGA